MSGRRTILVVEDGTEYSDAFRALVDAGSLDLVRAANRDEAMEILAKRAVDGVFLDVVFDRTPPENLAGDLEAEIRRFGGDRARAERHLAENQGFYLLKELGRLLPEAVPVVIAYDFSAEPERLTTLRARRPRLTGVADVTPISEVFEALTSGGTPGGLP